MKRLIFIFLIPAVSLIAQISPGDLTKFHQNLEGMRNCTKCHNLGEQLSNDKCLDCHTEIKTRINQNKGYHSGGDVKNKDCWKCHSEHNGRNFEIIHFDAKSFDHGKTGFELNGSHKKLECGQCHKKDFIVDPGLKKRNNTYLGLITKCSGCHEDIHRKTLGDKCSDCHDTNKFIPASNFSHDKTKFKLTGAHISVKCDKCHSTEAMDGRPFKKFTGLEFQQCTACHKDIHTGKFGNDCTKCHSTGSFKNINKASFNHDKTNFILKGKHNSVECGKCHGTNLSSKPKHTFCADCHKDYHKGDFSKSGNIRDCNECHTENGFSPSLYSIEIHNQTSFVLTGGHLAVPCQSCHIENKQWKFRIAGKQCIDCHKNPHGNEITSQFMKNSECRSCHSTNSWAEIKFDHSHTNFVLEGKHKSALCRNCHVKNEDSVIRYAFSSLTSECNSCHNDVHLGQFAINGKSDCGRCHKPDDWKITKFDHSSTRFSLTGAHSKLKCDACHKPAERENKKFIKYKIEDITCAACHS